LKTRGRAKGKLPVQKSWDRVEKCQSVVKEGEKRSIIDTVKGGGRSEKVEGLLSNQENFNLPENPKEQGQEGGGEGKLLRAVGTALHLLRRGKAKGTKGQKSEVLRKRKSQK